MEEGFKIMSGQMDATMCFSGLLLIFTSVLMPIHLMVYVNPERPREFLFNPKRDMTGIITGLLLGIIGLSEILPTGLTLVKTGLGA